MYPDGISRDESAVRLPDSTRQRAYRSARSHSGRVRAAKVALPVVAVAAVLIAGAWMWFSRAVPDIGIDISGTAIRGGKLVMANPKLDGLTSGDQPYSVRAARAIQDLTGSGAVDLERIQASVPLNAEVTARILANAGLYDSDKNTLDLRDSITVETTDGMRAELESAAIDMEKGNLSTVDPVRIAIPGATIEAERMIVEDRGKRLLFESSVKLVVEPGAFRPEDITGQPDDLSGARTGN